MAKSKQQTQYQYLTEKNVFDLFSTSRSYTEGLSDKFPEFERISRNLPHGSVPKELPKTTDGTTAAIIRKTPHRVIQQLPTGVITSDTNDWLSVIASFIYTKKIIPYANEGYALIQKCWQVVEKFMTFGFSATYTPFVNHDGYHCSDLRLIYWGDIFLQPGKLSDTDSNYMFMRSWWQTKDIERLIKSQADLSKDTEKTWKVEALNRVKDWVTSKDTLGSTPIEREKSINAKGGVEFITGFQKGVNAKFITFHVGSGEILRVKENKDPRGVIPINFAYGDIDGSNPFGRSVIELVGGMQNLMDGEVQMYQYNRALMLNPPIIKRGNFPKSRVKFAPNIIIDVGNDPQANIEALKIDSTALANFPNNYGLMKSQLLNLLASPDTSISSEVGNPGFSKTPAGVKQIQANLSVDDNYVRKQFETWFASWSETAINLFFAERTGIEELQLDKSTANKLRKLAAEGKFDEFLLTEDNKVRINYDSATEQLKFEVDASTSKMQDSVQQLESLQGLVGLLDKSPMMQKLIPPDKQIYLWNSIVSNSGVEDPEDLRLDDQEIEVIKQAALAPPPPPMGQPGMPMGMPPGQPMPQGPPPPMQPPQPVAPPPPPPSPVDQQLIQQFQQLGLDEQQTGQAMAMLQSGMPAEQVLQTIAGG